MSDIKELKAEIDKLETKINTCEDDKLRIMLFAEYNRLEGELNLTNKLNRKRITEDEFYDALDALDVEKKQEIDREMKELKEKESKKSAAERGVGSNDEPPLKRSRLQELNWMSIGIERPEDTQLLKISGFPDVHKELNTSIFVRECYAEYKTKFASFYKMIWMTGTPGTGKTTFLENLFFEEVENGRCAVYYFENSALISNHRKVAILEDVTEDEFKDICRSFTDSSPMILMDCPKDESDAVARVKNAYGIATVMRNRVIVASSPKEKIHKDLIVDWTNRRRDCLGVCFMKLWRDEEFDRLIIQCNDRVVNMGYEDDVKKFGNIPRLLFTGPEEYVSSLHKHKVGAFLKDIINCFQELSKAHVVFMDLPHHLFLINFEKVELYNTMPEVPFIATDHVWGTFVDYLEEKNSDSSIGTLISMAMHLNSGPAFEVLSFKYLAALKDGIVVTELLSENELKSETTPTELIIGPFSKLVKFRNVEEFKKIAEDLGDQVVTSTVKNWYTVDGFFKKGWLQMTVSPTHRISLTVAESTKLLGFPDQMKVMEKTEMNTGNFVFVVPKDVDFKKQTIGKSVSDKTKVMKKLKKNEKENAVKIKSLQTQLQKDEVEREFNTAMRKKLKQFVLKLSENDFCKMKDDMYHKA